VQNGDPKTTKLGGGKIKFLRGPVTIVATETDVDTIMDITIRLPDGSGDVRKVLTTRTCEEISRRLRQIDVLLDTYFDLDDEAEEPIERPAPKAARANGADRTAHTAATASSR
jgi:hypothetical protein